MHSGSGPVGTWFTSTSGANFGGRRGEGVEVVVDFGRELVVVELVGNGSLVEVVEVVDGGGRLVEVAVVVVVLVGGKVVEVVELVVEVVVVVGMMIAAA